ncbi:hypothetical protein BDQ17DRAFT_751029 [Cyathus striatus]|nr:hypothetical protein BDQ17DRAFT_751029 [Cyathus striatus]
METPIVLPSVFLRNCSCLAALVVLLYDHVITFRFEYKYIWKRPQSPVKSMYLFCRYFGLICQTVNAVLVFSKLQKAPVDAMLCRSWFTFLIASCSVLGTIFHIIVALRVYALHLKDHKIGILLAILLAVILGLRIHTWLLCYRHSTYGDICSVEYVPSSLLYLGKAFHLSVIFFVD